METTRRGFLAGLVTVTIAAAAPKMPPALAEMPPAPEIPKMLPRMVVYGMRAGSDAWEVIGAGEASADSSTVVTFDAMETVSMRVRAEVELPGASKPYQLRFDHGYNHGYNGYAIDFERGLTMVTGDTLSVVLPPLTIA